jgi:hypothetical protein
LGEFFAVFLTKRGKAMAKKSKVLHTWDYGGGRWIAKY